MDVIEKAIRNAFEKGNPEDQAFRLKVYRSAFTVLDRAIAATPGTTPEEAEARREALKRKIAEIEGEFVPAVEVEPRRPAPPPAGAERVEPSLSPATAAEPPLSAPPVEPSAAPRVEPGLASAPRSARSVPPVDAAKPPADGARGFEPSIDPDDRVTSAGVVPEDIPVGAAPYGEADPSKRRRRSYGGWIAALVAIAVVGGGIWWAAESGLLSDADSGAAPALSEAGQKPAAGGEGPLKESETEAGGNWITIFTPGNPATAVAPSGTEANAMEKDGVAFLRIRSRTPGAEVGFDVGQGVLENIAGKHAVFDIVARTGNGARTEIAVDCDFGTLGDCGRKRYQVGDERNDFLFEMDMPDKQPEGAGKILIDSDIDGEGKSVDIIEIKVSTAK